MSEASGHENRAFRPIRGQRWWNIGYAVLVGLLEAGWVHDGVDGDWRRAWPLIPAALAFMSAFAGSILLIALVVEGVRHRRWMDLSDLVPNDALGWLQRGLWLVALFLYSLHISLPDKYPGVSGTDWGQVLTRLVPNTGDILALGGAALLLITTDWWFGFAERDRQRAMERDRIAANQVIGDGGS